MNDYKNFCEYVIKPEPNGRSGFLRALLITAYTLFSGAYVFVFWGLFEMWTLLILLPFLLFALYKLTWPRVNVVYDVALEAGELTVAAIYGGVSRRVKFRAYIPEASLITPFTEGERALSGGDVTDTKQFTAGVDRTDTYVIIFPDKKRGKKTALAIDVTPELLRILRLCNPSVFIAKK